MDPAIIVFTFVFIVLLLLSAFFSGAETAFFSLNKSTLEKLAKSKKGAGRQVVVLLKEPKKLLISIVIGNTAVNVAIASIAAILASRLIQQQAEKVNEFLILLLNVFIVTFAILFFSEIMPKITAVKDAKKWSQRLAYPMTFFYYLFFPVTGIFHLFTEMFTSKLGFEKNKYHLSDEELRTLVDVGEEKGALLKEEKEMIHSIMEMSETVAREIMVPRTDMIGIDKKATLSQVFQVVKDKVHSRIPVFDESIDNITGILYLKDLLPFIRKKNQADFDLAKIVHAPYYVPEQKKINELLREFQRERIHMAVVVDEYGGTAGIVTLEDVIEEIVGEIQDEYDSEMPLFQKINESTFVVDASMQLDEINEELGFDLPTEEGVDTLAGFLLGQFGSVPKIKDKIFYSGYEFIIEKATKKRIQQVRILIKSHKT